MIGRTIDHYQVLAKLGEGGMGVVYRARDMRLERDIALKFIPSYALSDPDVRLRFTREAKAAAQLNHPNIATVFGIGETAPEPGTTEQEQAYIAMELVEGETLAARIKRGPLRLEEAIEIGCQVAEGLHAAHEKEVVHRDVKPSNIMLVPVSGGSRGGVRAKIMDFGLATTAASTRLTKTSATFGTVAYMSPEQARGERVDQRTDVWSLGVLLYEMIAGRTPFAADSESAVLFEIVNMEPEPLTAIRTGVPTALERVVAKCLEKDRARRYQHIEEVAVDLTASLEDVREGVSSRMSAAARRPARIRRWLRGLPWSLAAASLLAALILFWNPPARHTETVRVQRWRTVLPEGAPMAIEAAGFAMGQTALALSPDGSLLVYAGLRPDQQTQLYLRPLDGFDSAPVPNTTGAYQPFFSPDGQWIGFFADERLKRVSLSTGLVETLCTVAFAYGAAWGENGQIVFADRDGTVLTAVEASTGRITLSRKIEHLFSLALLPGGKHVLAAAAAGVTLISLETGENRPLSIRGQTAAIGSAVYVPTGHLLYTLPGRLVAVPFDLDRLDAVGDPVTVIESLRTEAVLTAGQFAVSNDGTLVYVPGGSGSVGTLVRVDATGNEEDLGFPSALFGPLKLSPDGRYVAVSKLETKWDVWVYDIRSGNRTKITQEGNNFFPVWSPDGQWVVFASFRGGLQNLFRKRPFGSAEEERLTASETRNMWPESFSPDGTLLSYSSVEADMATVAMLLDLADGNTVRPLHHTRANEYFGSFSPDGRYMAYVSDVSDEWASYVEPFPIGPGQVPVPISVGGGYEPLWSPSGDRIFYKSANRFMEVPIETEPVLRAGNPGLFAEGPYLEAMGIGWDVDRDGEHLLVIRGTAMRSTHSVNVVVNWFDELQRMVPAR